MDISSLRERRSDNILTVSELNGYIKGVLEADRLLGAVTVKGEISNFTYHRSGHLYFTLKDDGGQIKSVMFRSSAMRLKFMPENGMRVTVHGNVNIYTKDGSVQLYVNQMNPDGIGALYLAYEQLKEKLLEEGLFDKEHKMPIPRIPGRIGVITSPTGAAIRDILNVLGRRFPLADVYLYPSLVQGEDAPRDLVRAVDYFDRSHLVDVIIIGRGGGSLEDLWAFNNEELARRIYTATVPIISAVGHETDFTICDFVADLRAPTPSAAAELVVPDVRELMMRIDSLYDYARDSFLRLCEKKRTLINILSERGALKRPGQLFDGRRGELSQLYDRSRTLTLKSVDGARAAFLPLAERLDALSPLATLKRGYTAVTRDGTLVKSASEIDEGDLVSLRFYDGVAETRITKKGSSV